MRGQTSPSVYPLPQQLLDMRSYPSKNILYRFAAMSFTDHFARRSWRMILKNHKPDAVFFLGDLLDSGVEGASKSQGWCAAESHGSPFADIELHGLPVPQ